MYVRDISPKLTLRHQCLMTRIECEINIGHAKGRREGSRDDGNYHACNDRADLMTDGLAQNATAGINRWRAVTTPEGKNARRQRRPRTSRKERN